MPAFQEHRVPFNSYHLYARESPGAGPAIVLLHGFPDDLHLYDHLVPFLRERQVIAFDFLGWGLSDKPAGYRHTATGQTAEVDAVVNYFKLQEVVLVAHDASGPPAIDWSLDHPERVTQLVLLNTYYSWMPTLRAPEAIALYSTPVIRAVARAIVRRWDWLDARLYTWQVGRFMRDEPNRKQMLAQLYPSFRNSREAFWSLNNDLLGTLFSRLRQHERLRAFTRPVRIIFGDADPYLNRGVARRFHKLLPTSTLFLLPTARHYVQVDEPQKVAELVLAAPGVRGSGPAA
jgi:pimeloyl-ACP methyl ester carboxylesterase